MEDQYDFLGMLWIIYGSVMAGIFVFFLPSQELLKDQSSSLILLLWTLVFFSVGIVGGFMLRRRHPWARILLLFYALLNIINFPFGMILGIYTFYVLLRRRRRNISGQETE